MSREDCGRNFLYIRSSYNDFAKEMMIEARKRLSEPNTKETAESAINVEHLHFKKRHQRTIIISLYAEGNESE